MDDGYAAISLGRVDELPITADLPEISRSTLPDTTD
jgi:hypothetical protein